MSSTCGRCNSNERGSSYDRRARRAWLVTPAAGWGGDGEKVPCWECGLMVDTTTMIVDRIVSGEDGGRYVRANIRPHCSLCSGRQGAARTQVIRKAKRAPTGTDHWTDDEGRYAGPLRLRPWPPAELCDDVPAWAVAV